jgi:hypothetical protein
VSSSPDLGPFAPSSERLGGGLEDGGHASAKEPLGSKLRALLNPVDRQVLLAVLDGEATSATALLAPWQRHHGMAVRS